MVRAFRSRRSFLCSSLAASLALSLGSVGQCDDKVKSLFQAVELNHLSLDITQAEHSEEFYRVVFGLTAVSHGRGGRDTFMHFSQGFLNMRPSGSAGMNHFCFSIKDFDGNGVYQLLDLAQTEPFRMGGRNLHCYDPDRLNVQVQEEQHGWGRINGSQLVDADKGLFKTVHIHHVSLNVTDIAESQKFYQEIFGLPLISRNEKSKRVLLGVGPSAWLELNEAEQAEMNHFCYAVENFDAKKLPDELEDWVTGEISEPEPGVIRFKDPQGITVEVTSPDHKMS